MMRNGFLVTKQAKVVLIRARNRVIPCAANRQCEVFLIFLITPRQADRPWSCVMMALLNILEIHGATLKSS